MPDSKYFGIPFATSGDRATIPEATQPSGSMSFTEGFGPDYARDPESDPLAKRVPRDQTNEYLFQITNALKWLQLYGMPEWYAVDDNGNPVTYPLGARVRHTVAGSPEAWVSIVANNVAQPGTDASRWVRLAAPTGGNVDIPVLGWQSTPPPSPQLGARYVVAASPTGAWAGAAGRIAEWMGSWSFAVPIAGLQVQYWSGGRQIVLRYDGSAWAEDLSTETAPGRISNQSVRALARGTAVVFATPGATQWVCPEGVSRVSVRLWGAGGGGGGASNASSNSLGSGAGGGAYAERVVPVTPGVSYTVTVGAGGIAGTVNAGAGGAGGFSSFANVVTAQGGSPGLRGNGGIQTTPGAGGTASGADFSVQGYPGGIAWQTSDQTDQRNVSAQGGGAFQAAYTPLVIAGRNNSALGAPGMYPGGGGGGGMYFAAGGTGANGLIVLEY